MDGAAADLLSPLTPADQAQAKIIELKSNPNWVKKHLSGSAETREEMAKLHELAFQPAPGSIISGAPSIEAQRTETAAHLGTVSDLSKDVLEHVRTGAEVSADEFRMAVAKKDSLFGDPSWREKYFRGDHEARKQKLLLDVILSSRIKLEASA